MATNVVLSVTIEDKKSEISGGIVTWKIYYNELMFSIDRRDTNSSLVFINSRDKTDSNVLYENTLICSL